MIRVLMFPTDSTLGFFKRALIIFLTFFPLASTEADTVTSTILAGGSHIDLTINTEDAPLFQPDVVRWAQNAADSVIAYYGHFPVPHFTLRVIAFDGDGVKHGTTWGRMGGLTRIYVGSKSSAADFADDWMLTHEMIHLAFPSMMGDEHHWIEEGISVYVEPIARIRAGHWTALQMWSDLVRDMPKGQPQSGDEGLDHTHTWGRTYWGGALFCFVADVEIRKQTKNKNGLEDALRAILNAGGDINEDWPIEKAFKVGDQAVGLDVLEKLYAEWKDKPVHVDLDAMWKQLGVEFSGGTVRLNDDAPLSAIRRAIEAGNASVSSKKPSASASSPGSPLRQGNDSADPGRPSTVFAGRTARLR
jgi:hypothetical protein